MEQQFKVRFSLSSKLMIGLAVLLIIVIGVLSTVAVYLVVQDKKAYTYQLQSLESSMLTLRLNQKISKTVESLKLYLSNQDPRLEAVTEAQKETLNYLTQSQSDLIGMSSYFVNGLTKELQFISSNLQLKLASELKQTEEDLKISYDQLAPYLEELSKAGFVVFEIKSQNFYPKFMVAVADLNLKDLPRGLPIAVAQVDSRFLSTQSGSSNPKVMTSKGHFLFSSDPNDLIHPQSVFTDTELYQFAQSSKLETGLKEFKVQEKSYLGGFSKTSFGLTVFTLIEIKKAMSAVFTLGERLVLLGIAALFVALLVAFLFSNTITKPIQKLLGATQQIAKGQFDVNPQISSRDEVGALSTSVVEMGQQIKGLLKESTEKTKLEEELKVAAAVQENLLPPREFEDDYFKVESFYQSANECGGDWLGFFRVGHKLTFAIADATGHGVPSALITAAARSCFSVIQKSAEDESNYSFSPSKMMSLANRVVFDSASTKIMMTFFIGVIDLKEKTLTYANAGHNPPWLFKKTGENFKMSSLLSKGTRLGETSEMSDLPEQSVEISSEDILFLYTDGLLENKKLNSEEQYGKKRAKNTVDHAITLGIQKGMDVLTQDVQNYGRGKAFDDDITLAFIQIKGSA